MFKEKQSSDNLNLNIKIVSKSAAYFRRGFADY